MDVTGEESSLFDSHDVLTGLVRGKSGSAGRDAVKEYLKRVKFPPVEDFKKGEQISV